MKNKKIKKVITTLSVLSVLATSNMFLLNNNAEANWAKDNSGNWYFIEKNGEYAKNKWKGSYYFGSNGVMLVNTWTPDGKFVDSKGKLVKGKVKENKTETKVNTTINNNINTVPIKNEKPKVEKLVNYNTYVKYYGQDDYRWANKWYGLGNLYNTGCVPASLSMIVSTYLNRDVQVPEIANKLYYNTNYFNKRVIGTFAEGVPYIVNSYGLKHKVIYNKEDLKRELAKGNIIYMAVDNQPFTVQGYSHAIVLRGIDDNENITVYNPHSSFGKVRKYHINKLWQHKSKDPDNLGLGSPVISIYK